MAFDIKHIALLGSTGSIGKQTLEVVASHKDMFCVEVLTANTNSQLLIKQAIEFRPKAVVIVDDSKFQEVRNALSAYDIEVLSGYDSILNVICLETIDIVLNALVGFAGLMPSIRTIEAHKPLALANKESLVSGGVLLTKLSKEYSTPIIPVDSEHSAIFQCLQGETSPIEKIILTASGGPFFFHPKEKFKDITVAEALCHPTWKMGSKVTIDSSSMMNKTLEVIEAYWLFGVEPAQIEIVIHPQSIVHSMVQFADGCFKAQLSMPDMRLPIQYALSFPERPLLSTSRIDFARIGSMEFYAPDFEKFPALRLSYKALDCGGNMGCALNAANEVAVSAFLNGSIGFADISVCVEKVMDKIQFIQNPSLTDIVETHKNAIVLAQYLLTL